MGTRHPLIWSPEPRSAVPVLRRGPARPLPAGRPLRVLTWNLQYLAGRGYVFFYDHWDWTGPDERPSPLAVARTLDGVAAALRRLDADVLLLQELDDGATRSGGADQLTDLWDRLDGYPVGAEAFYWRSRLVPHPRVRSAVGMKLAILSRWDLRHAERVQLALIPNGRVRQAFGMKRALLRATIAREDGDLVAMSTHLDAFAQGTDTMQRQVAEVGAELTRCDAAGTPWVVGGDFNLLTTDDCYGRISPRQQAGYGPTTELTPLLRHRSIPAATELAGDERRLWHTYFANDPEVPGPDRVLDYLFVSDELDVTNASVVQTPDLDALSDHYPVTATLSRRSRSPSEGLS